MKVETIFEFVRFSIDEKENLFRSYEDLDWEALYTFAQKQGIIGILYQGVKKMPEAQLPPDQILMKWYMQTEKIKNANTRLNEAVIQIASKFEKDGFTNCILKGQGNAQMYPIPELRTPGDVDIWPLGKREKIFKYVRKDFPKTEMLYHHLEYPILKDVMTEVHFFPMFLNNPLYNRRFQKWVSAVAKEQCENYVVLPQGRFSKPTDSFNVIYQLAHIRHHFFDEGVGLRQMMDYYYLLKSNGIMAKREELCGQLKKMGLYDFAGAVMYAMKEVFGLEEAFWLTPPREQVGKMVVEEILMTGNFGHQDNRFGDLKKKSRANRLTLLLKKNLRFWWYFPGEVVFAFLFRIGQPIWRHWAQINYSRS